MQDQYLITQLRNKITDKRPILGKIFDSTQNISVHEYAKNVCQNVRKVEQFRKNEFINTFGRIARKYFTEDEVSSITAQLQGEYCVSTAEHHGPMTHPFFVHSNLLASAHTADNIIVLSVGNVSLNNSSYPRGLIIHDQTGAAMQLPFFSSEHRMSPVFGHKGFTVDDITCLLKRIDQQRRGGQLTDTQSKDLVNIIETMYSPLAGFHLFSDQITATNALLWQYLFRYGKIHSPRLVNIQLEDVVLLLLQEHHLFNDSEIHSLLFDASLRNRMVAETDGLIGNFSLAEKKGTCLFWALPAKTFYRQQLWLQGDCLVSEQGYCLKLEPEEVNSAIHRGELIPNMFLAMVMLSEYYGIKCLGGFSQGTYLTSMAKAYHVLFDQISGHDTMHTSGLRSDLVLACFRNNQGALSAVSGLDLAIHQTPDSWNYFCQTAQNLTIEQSMSPLFPELYRILYEASDRDLRLLSLTSLDMAEAYHLNEKICPCITI